MISARGVDANFWKSDPQLYAERSGACRPLTPRDCAGGRDHNQVGAGAAQGHVEHSVLVLGCEVVDAGDDDDLAFESFEPSDRFEQDFPWLGVLVAGEFERPDDGILLQGARSGGTDEDDDIGGRDRFFSNQPVQNAAHRLLDFER